MSASLPKVIDYLVATFRALPLVAVPTLPWVVYDGFPGPQSPDNFVAIGGGTIPTISGREKWAAIGALKRDEDYLVEVAIASFVGGASDSTIPGDFSNAQQTARNQSFAMFDAIDTATRGTVFKTTLGNTVNIQAEKTDITVQQTDDTDPSNDRGRRCTIVFYIHVVNRI